MDTDQLRRKKRLVIRPIVAPERAREVEEAAAGAAAALEHDDRGEQGPAGGVLSGGDRAEERGEALPVRRIVHVQPHDTGRLSIVGSRPAPRDGDEVVSQNVFHSAWAYDKPPYGGCQQEIVETFVYRRRLN